MPRSPLFATPLLLALLGACADDAAPGGSGTDAAAPPAADAAQRPPAPPPAPEMPPGSDVETGPASPDASGPGTSDAATPGTSDAGGRPTALDAFLPRAAAALCGALHRCCSSANVDDYLAAFRDNELLADLAPRLTAEMLRDEGACRERLTEALGVVPFGDWLRAAEAGEVSFDGAAFDACVAALDAATCGAGTTEALFDSRCLALQAPTGGDEQRAMFHRTRVAGEACRPLRDGVGASFYGTCDPGAAFCCAVDPARPDDGCTFPFEADGTPRAGVCQAARAEGERCSSDLPLQLCRTGLDCDADTARCLAPAVVALTVGQACVEGFRVLGDCRDGFCDVLGTGRCEALRADGVECSAPYECQSGTCGRSRTCEASTFCTAPGSTPATDAGAPATDAGAPATDAGTPATDAGTPATDAGTPDAATATSAGETCHDAAELRDASTTLPPGSRFGFHAEGAFGASNDYDPQLDAGLPPMCSIVYPAPGREVVLAISLEPGDRLSMRYAVTDPSIGGGLYLLDSCDPVTWPDHDRSGACGSNEYRAAGYCGVLGCDPVELTFVHPRELDGTATGPRTYYLVLDAGSAAATAWTLDWSLAR